MDELRQVFLFGSPQFHLGGPRFDENDRVIGLTYRKGQALFAYLGATGKRHSRDALAALIWPDYSQTRARANLRRTLYAINQAGLGSWIDNDPNNLEMASSPPVEVDVVQFGFLIDQWRTHYHQKNTLCEKCLDDLLQATELYRADFLADFYLPDSNPFEEWAGLQREQLRQLYLQAQDSMAAYYLVEGEYAAARDIAYQQIESDNLRESAYRQLMVSLAQGGQRTVALQIYGDLEKLLDEELGVEPEGATKVIVDQIRSGEWETGPESNVIIASADRSIRKSGSAPHASPRLLQSPYRGLYAFREEDAPLFFGREDFTEQLLDTSGKQSLIAVVGPSGSGKSSVVYAGLIAQLRSQSDVAIASFRPTADPQSALAGALITLLQPNQHEDQLSDESQRLAKALATDESNLIDLVDQLTTDQEQGRLFLVADQFEELFTLCPDPSIRHQFLDILLEAVFDQQYRSEPLFTLVLTLRADFLGQALAYRPLADALADSDVKLGPMTGAELIRAIERPALAHGSSFESGLVARIRDDVAGEPGNLPLLEFALEMLWHQQEENILTHDVYESIGRVEGALTRYADEVYHGLSPEEHAAVRRIFIQLVQPGDGTEDTRRVATRAELAESDWTIVQDLADARLLTTSIEATGLETVEMVHEALIRGWGRLGEWMVADREFRLWQERLRAAIGQWETSDLDDGGLLRGVSLSVAESWQIDRSDDLSQAEIAYIQSSVHYRDRQQAEEEVERISRERFRRRLTYGIAAGALIMALLAILAVLQWNQADAQRQNAEMAELEALAQLAGQLSARSQVLQDEQLDVALLLGAEAAQLVENETTTAALQAVLGRNPALMGYGTLPFNPFSVTARNGPQQWGNSFTIGSAESEETAVYSPDWETASLVHEQSIRFPIDGKTLHYLANSHDDSLLAMAFCSNDFGEPCENPEIALWRSELEQFDAIDLGSNENELTSMTLNPDGRILALGNVDGSIVLWDSGQGRSLGEPMIGHTDAVSELVFSSDGRWLVSWSRDGLMALWDISEMLVESASSTESETSTTLAAQFGGHSAVTSLTFSPDSDLLISAGQSDDRLLIWNVEQAANGDGNPTWRLEGPQGGSNLAEFSPDGRYLLAGGNNGLIFQWSTSDLIRSETAPIPTILRGHQNFVSAFFYHEENGTMLSLAPDSTILWDLSGAALPRRNLEGHEQHVVNLAFSSDGNTLYSAACDLVGSGGPCSAAEFLSWDTASAKVHKTVAPGPEVETWDVRLSPDGALAFLGTPEQALALANPILESKYADAPLPLPISLAGNFALGAGGNHLATGNCQEADFSIPRCLSSALTLWEWPEGTIISQELDAHQGLIQDLAFSPDGKSLATAGEDGVLRLWNMDGDEFSSRQINSPAEEVHDAIAFSPDGTHLAGAGCGHDEAHGSCLGGAVWVWDLASGDRVGGPLLNDETAFNFFIAFSPDGHYLVTVDGAGSIIFWELSSGQRMAKVKAHTGPIVSMRFSPDGKYLATGGHDRLINLINVEALLAQAGQSPAEGIEQACRRAGRNLSPEEWSSFFGDTPYRATCPE